MSNSLELNKSTAKILSESRIREAKILFYNKEFAGAYYLAGYSVELALKSVICRTFKSETFPDKQFVNKIHTHKLDDLMKLSGLTVEFENDQKNIPELATFWTIATKWTEMSRYEIKSEQEAFSIIEAG